MSIQKEYNNLFSEIPNTWEYSWQQCGREPDVKDKFWKFRPPYIDPLKNRFGDFHYSSKSVELLDTPLRIDEMVELYYDLGERSKAKDVYKDKFQAERIVLALDIMEVVSSRVKHAKYPEILAEEMIHDRNLIVSGFKKGEAIYREASLVYPSNEFYSQMYVKGQIYNPNSDNISYKWMGPHKALWKEVDTSKRRSGIMVDTEEGPTYFWWFDSLAGKVGYAARKLHFRPDIMVSGYQGLKPVITPGLE